MKLLPSAGLKLQVFLFPHSDKIIPPSRNPHGLVHVKWLNCGPLVQLVHQNPSSAPQPAGTAPPLARFCHCSQKNAGLMKTNQLFSTDQQAADQSERVSGLFGLVTAPLMGAHVCRAAVNTSG